MTNPDSPGSFIDDATIDAEFEDAPPPPKAKGRIPRWLLISGVVLVLAALVLTGPWALRSLERDVEQDVAQEVEQAETLPPPPVAAPAAPVEIAAAPEPPAVAVADQDAEIAALRAEIAQMRDALAAPVPAAPAPALPAAAADDPALAGRVTALEQAALGSQRYAERLDRIDERLATLERNPGRRDFADLEARIAALEERGARNPAEAAYRFAALREAAQRGAPFEPERAALARLRPDDADLAALSDAAIAGVPTLEELRRSYPADEIRDALAQAPADTGRFAWARRLFGRVVTVRREDGDASAGERAVSAAEAALVQGDVAAAIEQTQRLSGPAADAASYWLGRAQARTRLDARIEAIQDALAGEAGR